MQNDWYNLGDVLYRKEILFEMKWTDKILKLDDYQISCSSFGGTLALIKDDIKTSTGFKIQINIFSSSGINLSKLEIESKYRVAGIGWSDLDQLIVVHEDGIC